LVLKVHKGLKVLKVPKDMLGHKEHRERKELKVL
jgi:hypothetical protein